MIISSFFTNNSIPATGLTPTLLIWSVTGTSQTLIIPSANMEEVGDGFYQYNFSTYDPTQEYLFRSDGGSTLDNPERYQAGTIELGTIDTTTQQNIANNVWNATAANFTTTGTMGLLENQIAANLVSVANNLYLSPSSVLDLVQLLLSYETNRTKIDPTACTLTVYEADCVTPLRVFELLDTNSNPSIVQIAERKPISANDGLPVCP